MEYVPGVQVLPLTDGQKAFELPGRQRTERLLVQKLLVARKRDGPTFLDDAPGARGVDTDEHADPHRRRPQRLGLQQIVRDGHE